MHLVNYNDITHVPYFYQHTSALKHTRLANNETYNNNSNNNYDYNNNNN